MPDIAKLLIAIGCVLFVGAILLLIGIMGENITRLRNQNVELKGEIKQRDEKIAELEKEKKHLKENIKELETELSKYDRKRRKKNE